MHPEPLVIGLLLTAFGCWLIQAPRESRIGTFLGPMIQFRLFAVLCLALGAFCFLVGMGLDRLGPYPIHVSGG